MRCRRSLFVVGALAAFAAVLVASPRASAQEPVTVFAAASLTAAVERIAELYEADTGTPVRLSFAASSTLARQITAGAPAQIYLSANERWMDHVAEAGLIDEGSRVSALSNRLVLIAPADSDLNQVTVDASLDVAALVDEGARIAMADPDHTPVGLYAKEALATLGLWAEVAPRLARTAEVRAAVALVASGEAPLGVVYATDAAVTPAVKIVGSIPPETHTPISYPFAIVEGHAEPAVEDVFAFLRGPEARAVFEEAGFTVR